MIKDLNKCDKTSWIYFPYSEAEAEELITLGQIGKSDSDRLSLTESCSLVLKYVTHLDVGHYTCRQVNKSGEHQGPDAVFVLTVVN